MNDNAPQIADDKWGETNSNQSEAYGCLFCHTGKEETVAKRLRGLPGVEEAFSARQTQHKSKAGVKSATEKIMLPGYVFFIAPEEINTADLKRLDYVIRLLQYGSKWQLQGGDLEFARWIHGHGGMIGMSSAYRVGDRVTIIDGPLKEMEGVIEKLDKHNRNGRVLINFDGKQIKVWLAFEYVTEETP